MNRRSFLRSLAAEIVSLPSAAPACAVGAPFAYGTITLHAKKMAVLIKVPNELLRFSAAEDIAVSASKWNS
jgi:hypothetical protein